MKKWYKLCPYCNKEIKSKAIKCQYCLKFLEEEKTEKECPYCLNISSFDTKVCPFCDEILVDDENFIDEDESVVDDQEYENDEDDKIDEVLEIKKPKNKKEPPRNIKKEWLIWLIILWGIFLIWIICKIISWDLWNRSVNSYKTQKVETSVKYNSDTPIKTSVNLPTNTSSNSKSNEIKWNNETTPQYNDSYCWDQLDSYLNRWLLTDIYTKQNIKSYNPIAYYSPILESCILTYTRSVKQYGGSCMYRRHIVDFTNPWNKQVYYNLMTDSCENPYWKLSYYNQLRDFSHSNLEDTDYVKVEEEFNAEVQYRRWKGNAPTNN